MTEIQETGTPQSVWSETMKSLLEYQWQLINGPYSIGLRLMERTLGPPGGAPEPTLAEKVRALQRQAAERVRRGLAPPREAYEAPYRDLIDWGAFPDWARPIDPEVFENCGHEG
jgi:hypothetical protein